MHVEVTFGILYFLQFFSLVVFVTCFKINGKEARAFYTVSFSCIALFLLGYNMFYTRYYCGDVTLKNSIKTLHEATRQDSSSFNIENQTKHFNVVFKRMLSSTDKNLSTTTAVYFDKGFFSVPRNVPNVNCFALFEGNDEEKRKASRGMSYSRPRMSEWKYQIMTRNCEIFKARRRYITSPLIKEEEDFPIAFSIVTYKDIEQTERLLRAIYRPQNFYCIHADKKSKHDFRYALHSIADCFDNVFLASKSIDVEWGAISTLQAGFTCLKDLVMRYKKWKYFLNLTGQEFPLRTNYELKKILTIYNGSNDVEGTVRRANPERWSSAGKPPHGITPIKGSHYVTVNRKFAEYAVYDRVALEFFNWTMHTVAPEETYYASLNHNPHLGIPGSYKGLPETDKIKKPFLTRFVNWGSEPFNWPCEGQRVRSVCIFGVGDLPLLCKRPEMFANKFYQDYQPSALDCMEELLYNRTRDEYLHKYEFDTKFYESVDFIKNKV